MGLLFSTHCSSPLDICYSSQYTAAMQRKLLVTHHAPDLDAIGSVWLFKRFDTQHYGTAKVAFVNPGDTLSEEEIAAHNCIPADTTHVDTGMGEFDHHQPERGQLHISASSLVYDHVCEIHPDLRDDAALKFLVEYITEIDHFGEVHWPDAGNLRYSLMIHNLLYGKEHVDPHDDESQLNFGLQCLDGGYALLTEEIAATEIVNTEGTAFETEHGRCLALESANAATVKRAQKEGFQMVIRKNPHTGHVAIKARPDSSFNLRLLADAVLALDQVGTWYYHPSNKMFLNSSNKHRDQVASPLTLEKLIELTKQAFGTK